MARKRLVALVGLLMAAFGCSGPTDAPPEEDPEPTERIAYVIDTATCDDCHLTSIDPDGSDPLEYPDLSFARWSPDGTRLAAVVVRDDGRIGTNLVDADGANVTPIDIASATLNVGCMAWSPDGSTLLCEGWDNADSDNPPGLFSVDVATSELTRVTTDRLGGHDIPTDYSPDGTQILFAREDPGRGAVALFVAAPDGTDATRITPWSDTTGGGRWSPDGSRILFTDEGRLRTVAPDGSGSTVIPADFGEGSAEAYGAAGWSPDGTRIVFSLFLERSGQVDLFTVGADGTGLVQLTDSPEPDEFPDWGPAPPLPS